MTDAWPRNIVPYDEKKLRALCTPAHVALHEAAPLHEVDLTPAERVLAQQLLEAGLLRRDGTRYVVTQRHRRDAEQGTGGRLEHKQAVVASARELLDQTGASLDARGADATAAIGIIALPETPDAIARAFGILAEAEDQLRALREEMPRARNAPQFQILLFIGSQTR